MKMDHLMKWCKNGKCMVFVDDKPIELKLIKDQHEDVNLIRMRRENGKYSDQETPDGSHEATTMQDIIDIVQTFPPHPDH